MQEIIQKLVGQKCFVANHVYGTMLKLKIGYPQVDFSDDEKNIYVEGEWGVTVEAADWTINYQGQKTSVAASSTLTERKAAISDFINQTVERVNFNPDSFRLTLFFTQGISLNVYIGYAQEMNDNKAKLWSLKTPTSIISFYKNGKFTEENEPKGIKKLTIPH